MPEIVAVCFVNRLMTAAPNSDTVISPRPSGNSRPPIFGFSGTFHSRVGASGSVYRSTNIASDLNAKLQTTPNAYASPRTYTLPRLTMMVNSCSSVMRLISR